MFVSPGLKWQVQELHLELFFLTVFFCFFCFFSSALDQEVSLKIVRGDLSNQESNMF